MTNNISLIINCKKENIKNIDMSYFNDKYARIYFNIKPDNKEYLNKIINTIETKYYNIWDFDENYKNIYNLTIYSTNQQNIDISILIPVYNCEKYIKDCLDSCLNQDFSGNYEIIIVDDGSDDNTVKLIKEYNDNKIKLYQKKHSGISDTLNYGLAKCNGKYICRMDGDDVMYEYRLKYQYLYMENHEDCDILASNINRYIDNEIYTHAPSLEVIKKNITIEDLFNKETNYNFICHPAICFKKVLYNTVISKELCFYDSKYDLAEDYELYVRLIKYYNVTINTDETSVLKYNVFKSSKEKEQKINQLRNKIFSIYCKEKLQSYSIGIYYIATGIYKNDFSRFLLSVKNFFPSNHKTIILISDGLTEYDKYEDKINNININVVHINDYPWPINTLFKMKYIEDNIINVDYIFYFNANSEILPIKSYDWFDKDKLIFTYHKDWFNNDCHTYKFCEPFMDNPNSTSYIGTIDYTYIQGAFFGGPTNKIYEMCKTINNMIMIDLQNNIIPRYHDETYLNKYNYLYENDGYISNILISEIVYNINDLSDIQPSQFIILHENIYDLTKNNKANKFDNIIPFNYLKPLYNYDNIYEYYDKYPTHEIDYNIQHSEKNVLLFILLQHENEQNNIEYMCNIVPILKQNYEIICINDSRIDKFLLEKLYKVFDSKHIFGLDIISLLYDKHKQIKAENISFELENVINILFYNDYWHNLFSNLDFNSIMIINSIDEFKEEIENINNYLNNDYDFICNSFNQNNVYEYDNNHYVKKFKLFKYKYKFKTHTFCNINNCILSRKAYEFLYKYKDEIKLTIPHYYMPTLLHNNEYKIIEKNKLQ